MILRETLEIIRQTEIRTNDLVTKKVGFACERIPTRFRPPAQACEERATLGYRRPNISNRNAVAATPVLSVRQNICHNPVGLVENFVPSTQGSSCVATLGWRTQSLWDWPNCRHVNSAADISKDAGSGSPSPWGEGGLQTNFSPACVSLQSPPQFHRISRVMPDGADDYFGSFAPDHKKYGIRPWFWQSCFASQPADQSKPFGIFANDFEKRAQVTGKPLPRLARIIEIYGLSEFSFSLPLDSGPKTHHLARNRFSISATTSSSGRQRSGCASALSARRSSSAISLGVSSSSKSPNSISMVSTSSRRSASGIRRSSSRISALLMATIYPVDSPAQATFSFGANGTCISEVPPIYPPADCQSAMQQTKLSALQVAKLRIRQSAIGNQHFPYDSPRNP